MLADLPDTRSGDAIRALIAAVIFVLVLAAQSWIIGGWWSTSWRGYLFMGPFYGLWMFAFYRWFRWLHRPVRELVRESFADYVERTTGAKASTQRTLRQL
jgi:hypothetical protein